ncbi:MAG TPA: methionyl-tRNA formyltransferase [Paludibacteraceae bacterium]|nr:methionyl-tRNA formyltransferase [Paludibacteraceae bacterium]
MTKNDLRIVFMGTPEFAVASLDALVSRGYKVVGVVTMPDKPAGRGYKIQVSAVKTYALTHNLPILQPEKLKDDDFLEKLKALKADLQIVVAFRMLPEVVWNMPPMGTFNLHGSLLPQYRGAAPINWAIINGEKETGVTTFFLQHEIDTGDLILQKKMAINHLDNAETIHDKLMVLGAQTVVETVDRIVDGTAPKMPQPMVGELKTAPKIFKETCKIDWNNDGETIYNFVRGLSPYPTAWSELDSNNKPQIVKIYDVESEKSVHRFGIGKIITDGKKELKVTCKDGFVAIKELQLAGKKRMPIAEFLRGYKSDTLNQLL